MSIEQNLFAIEAQLTTTVKAKQTYWDALRELERLTGKNGEWTDNQSAWAGNAINVLAAAGEANQITAHETTFFLKRLQGAT